MTGEISGKFKKLNKNKKEKLGEEFRKTKTSLLLNHSQNEGATYLNQKHTKKRFHFPFPPNYLGRRITNN